MDSEFLNADPHRVEVNRVLGKRLYAMIDERPRNGVSESVCQIPTEDDSPAKSIALALQRVFFNLQYSLVPVGKEY